MGAAAEVFQYLKRRFSGLIPEGIKASLRPWIFRLVYPAKKSIFETSCSKKDLSGLAFKYEKNPVVSVIIPAYNQLEYTLRCLFSIVKNTKKGPEYEVILADDNSTDGTKDITNLVKNLVVVRNKENLGFLKNCNNAAKKARGKYLLFLNNDTFVQPGWLNSMHRLTYNYDKIGIIGSKLVFSDGRLQEAGGIVWKDASAANYGKFMDPGSPEYNYIKEVDYVSGAAMFVNAKLWNQTGGFDERYAPAYFEDTDLAFEARKRGYKVFYQPESVVVHFEGASHGTDVSKGIKKYQEINREKFRKKWAKELLQQLPAAGENIFSARDRSRDRKTIVFIDRSAPEFDRDAGGRMVYQHARFFAKKGFNVKFLGDDFIYDKLYTMALQMLGIEAFYSGFYSKNWRKWFSDNSRSIDYIFLSRPGIAAKYIDFVKGNTKAKILYQGHDLNYIREQRRAQVGGGAAAEKKAGFWEKTEFDILNKADISFYPSSTEVALLKSKIPKADVRLAPLYVYDGVWPLRYDYRKRKDLLFVGGFGHAPNRDGVLWFCREVMPLVAEKIPDIRFNVVGSNPPPEIKALESRNVVIKGYVPDEELERVYEQCRMSVAPLRFGAGLKGKIVEAMYWGLPVVTTTVGAEGIDNKVLYISDSAEGFAAHILKNYNSAKLGKISGKARKYLASNFSEKGLERAFADILPGARTKAGK